MATIQELRQQYPQYSDLSDQSFADKFHDKFYSDMPQAEFYKKIGLDLKKPNTNLVDKLANMPLTNAVLGAGDAIRNNITGAASLIPGVNIKPVQNASGTAYNVGNLAGNIGSYIAGGEALGTAKLASKIPQLAKSIGGNALFGAIQNPDHQIKGALEGGLAGTAGYAAGKLFGMTNPVLKAIGGSAIGAAIGAPLGSATGLGFKPGAEVGGLLGGGAALHFGAPSRAAQGVLGDINLNEPEVASRRNAAQELGYKNQSPAEATGSPADAVYESQIASTPEGQAKIYKYKKEGLQQQKNIVDSLLKQVSPNEENQSSAIREAAKTIQQNRESVINKEDQSKIDNILKSISPSEEDVSSQVRDTAKSIINKKISERSAVAKPLYDAAGKEQIPSRSMTQIIKDPNLAVLLNKTISDTKNIYDLEGYQPNSIKVLEVMRQDLKDKVDSLKSGANPDYSEARKYKIQLDKLDEIMDSSGDKIVNARNTYRRLSEPINKLQNGVIGKLSNLDDTQLKNVASTIFDRKQTNIKDFNDLRDKISQENPEVWKGIVRNAMEDRLNKVKSGDPSSIFYKTILGSKRDFDQFHESLAGHPEAQKQLLDLKRQFPESSKQLKELRKPMIARISNLNDSQLKNISSTIFDPSQTDMKMFVELRDEISKQNPEAWRGLMRNEMERRLANTNDEYGTNFYEKILKDDRSFNQFMAAAKNMPDVQAKLVKMRQVFKTLINPETPKEAILNGRGEESTVKPRGALKQVLNLGDSLVNGRYNRAAAELLTNPRWDKEFNQLVKIKNRQKKIERFGNLLGAVVTSFKDNPTFNYEGQQ